MRNVKRNLLIILALIFFNQLCYSFPSDIDDVPYTADEAEADGSMLPSSGFLNTYRLLNYLGIIETKEDEMNPDVLATKGLAAEWFSKMALAGLSEVEISYFSDVPKNHIHAAGINNAAMLGIIDVKEKIFQPNKTLSIEDAVYMAVYALKYDILLNGQPPVNFAVKYGLLKGIDLSSKSLTTGQLMLIIENSLKANLVEIDSVEVGGHLSLKINKEKSILTENKKIILQKGILTGISAYSIYGGDGIKDDELEINRSVFKKNISISEDFLGHSVFAYIDMQEDKKLVIALWMDENLNASFEIDSENFEKSEEERIHYLKNDKASYISISNDAKVLINNCYYSGMKKAVEQNAFSGLTKIILTDNNGDNKYDIIKITKYEYYLIDKVSQFSQLITFMYGKGSLDLKSENAVYNISMDGNAIMVNDLKPSDVLCVALANRADGIKAYKIIVSRNKAVGLFEEAYSENANTIYTIDGEKYIITKEYETYLNTNTNEFKPQIGKDAEFLLSFDNKIVGSRAVNEFVFGYLFGTSIGKTLDKICKIKVYDILGRASVYEVKEKVKYYSQTGKDKNPNAYLDGAVILAESAFAEMAKIDTDILTNVIAFRLNNDGIVDCIVTPYDNRAGKPEGISYPLTLDAHIHIKGTSNENRIYRNVLGNKYNMPNSTPIIIYPDDPDMRENEKAYEIKNGASYGVDKYFDDEAIALFNLNKFYAPQFAAIKGMANPNVKTDSNFYVINSISESISEEDEIATKITFYQNKSLISKLIANDAVIVQDGTSGKKWAGQPDDIKELSKGDIIQFETNSLGNISLVRVLFKYSNPPAFGVQTVATLGNLPLATSTYTMQVLTLIYGKVEDIKDNIVLVNTSPNGDNENEVYPNIIGHSAYGAVYYTLFDSSKHITYTVTLNEIQVGDKVVMRKYYNHVMDVAIIR